jgi:hypothetical protein
MPRQAPATGRSSSLAVFAVAANDVPRREKYTICTAVAPEAVFTVRTYGTAPLYSPD